MILITDFVDYYDCMNYAFGQDKVNRFERKIGDNDPIIFKYSALSTDLQNSLRFCKTTGRVDNLHQHFYLVFCDNVYMITHTPTNFIYHTLDTIESYFNKRWDFSDTKGRFLQKDLLQQLRQYTNLPYFIVTDSSMTMIPRSTGDQYIHLPVLKDIGFQLIKDANQCFQEIEMWLSAQNDKPIIQMSNDIRIAQHGFDLKTSFRKR